MGKPFEKELASLESTYKSINSTDIGPIKDKFDRISSKPLYIIGSGGSLSACYYAELLHQKRGKMAKAITPLESSYLQRNLNDNNVLIVSASGRNKDILFAFEQAVYAEPDSIVSICTTRDSPLAKKASKYSNTPLFEFPLPTGKDGFLASNSLLAFFSILARAYNFSLVPTLPSKNEIQKFQNEIAIFLKRLDINCSTFHVLYGGWAKPVAIDIESKLTEAALANTLLADYRNFGHGRHHWFDKRKKNSAIVLLITPEEEKLAEKTLSHLPKDIPVLKIVTQNKSASSSIDLLVKSFYLVNEIGRMRGIDPGRPGVPAFGSKLYHLNYVSFYTDNNSISKTPILEIQRKIWPQSIFELSKSDLKKWISRYRNFTNGLKKTRFGAIVLDYDRTLCSDDDRFTGLAGDIVNELMRVVRAGFLIGVVTGRGVSVRNDLRRVIERRYWKNIIVGYYNGAQVSSLFEDSFPDRSEGSDAVFLQIRHLLGRTDVARDIVITQRSKQLTIESTHVSDWETIKAQIYQNVMSVRGGSFVMLESSRSIDVVIRPEVSKLNIIDFIRKELQGRKLPSNCLCIGDKGKWPGNDYELLKTDCSLSVNEVSHDPATCWNLSPVGIRNTDSCVLYLKSIKVRKQYLNFQIK